MSFFTGWKKNKMFSTYREVNNAVLTSSLPVTSFIMFKDKTVNTNVNLFLCTQAPWKTLVCKFVCRVPWPWTNQVWMPFILVMCFLSCGQITRNTSFFLFLYSHTPPEVTSQRTDSFSILQAQTEWYSGLCLLTLLLLGRQPTLAHADLSTPSNTVIDW